MVWQWKPTIYFSPNDLIEWLYISAWRSVNRSFQLGTLRHRHLEIWSKPSNSILRKYFPKQESRIAPLQNRPPVSFSKNIYTKGNRASLAAAEDIYGQPLRQEKFFPHLLCRPWKHAWKVLFLSKRWSVKVRVLSKRWSDVQKYHNLCHATWLWCKGIWEKPSRSKFRKSTNTNAVFGWKRGKQLYLR